MSLRHKFFATLFFSAALCLVSAFAQLVPQVSAQADVNYSITSPSGNVPEGEDIEITITGAGYQVADASFSLWVGITDEEPVATFSFDDTDTCHPGAIPPIYTEFQCEVTDPENDLWELTATRSNRFLPGPGYYVKLNNGEVWVIDHTFSIGDVPLPDPDRSLTVSISPEGPFKNSEDHTITISWEPAETQAPENLYTVDISSFGIITEKTCTNSPCSTEHTIPRCTSSGTKNVTVTKSNRADIKGIATFTIEDEQCVPTPTPTLPPAGLPPCKVGYIGTKANTVTIPALPILSNNPTEEEREEYNRIAEERKELFKTIDGCLIVETAIGDISTDPTKFVGRIMGLLLSISGSIAVILIIYSGYQIMMSRGDPEKIGAARERLTSAIVGLLFIIFSLVILEVIGVDILRLPGFNEPPQDERIVAPTSAPIPPPPVNNASCGQLGRRPCREQGTTPDGCRAGLDINENNVCDELNCGDQNQQPCREKYFTENDFVDGCKGTLLPNLKEAGTKVCEVPSG